MVYPTLPGPFLIKPPNPDLTPNPSPDPHIPAPGKFITQEQYEQRRKLASRIADIILGDLKKSLRERTFTPQRVREIVFHAVFGSINAQPYLKRSGSAREFLRITSETLGVLVGKTINVKKLPGFTARLFAGLATLDPLAAVQALSLTIVSARTRKKDFYKHPERDPLPLSAIENEINPNDTKLRTLLHASRLQVEPPFGDPIWDQPWKETWTLLDKKSPYPEVAAQE